MLHISFLVKVLHHALTLPLARELVPFFLMTCAVLDQKPDLLTVQVMALAIQTTVMDMLMMLVWCVVKVSKQVTVESEEVFDNYINFLV